ncbi:MAG: hypothetical protein R6V67_10910 [Spirochaetia bacterium]
MLISRLFRRHGAEVLEAMDQNELFRLLRGGRRSIEENHPGSGSVGERRLVVLGEPPPYREEHETVHSLPRSFPEYTFILLAGGTVYSDTAQDSLFHGVVNKPFKFQELLDVIDNVQ